MTGYLSPVLEYLMMTFSGNALAFFDLVYNIVYIKAICFACLFAIIYLGIFIYFIRGLNQEIWQTHCILNMIPLFILENNLKVREQVWARKGIN